jgi:threonine/homoserine/homoserine lactone efflux protein
VGQAIGQILSLAVGVAISPIPIIGVVLMLVTPRARVNGPAFVLGWLLGLSIVGAIVLLAAPSGTSDGGSPATWVSTLELVLGALLVLMAAKQWRGRPHGDEQAATPKWMGAIDGFNAVKALAAGVVLSGANPKNLLLAIAAAAAIVQTDIPGNEQAGAYAVFALIGTIGVAVPVVIYFGLGDRAGPILQRLKSWLAQNNGVIMAILLLLIGVKLIGDAIAGFSS